MQKNADFWPKAAYNLPLTLCCLRITEVHRVWFQSICNFNIEGASFPHIHLFKPIVRPRKEEWDIWSMSGKENIFVTQIFKVFKADCFNRVKNSTSEILSFLLEKNCFNSCSFLCVMGTDAASVSLPPLPPVLFLIRSYLVFTSYS